MDEYDNVLIQLQGKKRITVFDACYANDISRDHFVKLADNLNLMYPENILLHPWLGKVPRYTIELNSGDAIVIPAAAHHHPVGLSFDSLSLNSFFVPKRDRGFRSIYAHKETPFPWWMINLAGWYSRTQYPLIGKPAIRTGHYEVI